MAKHCTSLGARTGARTAKLRAHDPRVKPLLIQWRGAFRVGRPKGTANAFLLAGGLRGGGRRAQPLMIQWRGAFEMPKGWRASYRLTASGTAKDLPSARAPVLGPSPMAEPRDSSRPVCKQFCSARLRARTQGGALDRHWQSASHKRRAAALACERYDFQLILSRLLACERGALRPILSRPFHHFAVCAVRLTDGEALHFLGCAHGGAHC